MKNRRDGLIYFVTTTIISIVVYIFMSLVVPQILDNFDPVGMEGYVELYEGKNPQRLNWKLGFKKTDFVEDEATQ